MVSISLLPPLIWGALWAQMGPRCYSLNYVSQSDYLSVKNFPAAIQLGSGGKGSVPKVVEDTAGKWGTPLIWNTYRERGDSVVVWLADGNREVRIAARIAGDSLDGYADVRIDVPVVQLARVNGRRTPCAHN